MGKTVAGLAGARDDEEGATIDASLRWAYFRAMRLLRIVRVGASVAAAAAFFIPSAAADTYCVTPATGCDGVHTVPTIAAGFVAAAANPGDDVLQLGAATYSENGLAYAGPDAVDIVGAGPGATVVQRATPLDSSTTLSGRIDVRALTVRLLASAGPDAIGTSGRRIANVDVEAQPGTTGPTAVEVSSPTTDVLIEGLRADLPVGSFCVHLQSFTTTTRIERSTITGCSGAVNVQADGMVAIVGSRLAPFGTGVSIGRGTTTVDDTVIRPGAGGVGVGVSAQSGQSPVLRVRHTTIVGSGIGTGASAFNAVGGLALLELRHTIIRGVDESLRRTGSPGRPASITGDQVSYATGAVTSSGDGTISLTNVYDDPDPKFLDPGAGDFRLAADSPHLDRSSAPLGPGEPATDIDGNLRIINGSRDLGAHERPLPASATTGDATAISTTGATIAGTVDGGGAPGTWRVLYGPTAAYGSATAPQAVGASLSPVAVAGVLSGLAPFTGYHYAVELTTAAGTVTGADRTFATLASPVVPPAPSPLPSVAPALFPAKLEIARASVLRSERRLSVLAPITARASGEVRATFTAAGRTTRFTAPVDHENRRVRISRGITGAQARLGTGIFTLAYPGDADTQPQTVRLRAASGRASLDAGRPKIEDGRLAARGRLTSRARGVVRLQLVYEPPVGEARTLEYKDRISSTGRYSFDVELPPDVVAEIATRRGVVHSYTLFTGYLPRRIRGEMESFQVLGAR